jgi:hypothetical protein
MPVSESRDHIQGAAFHFDIDLGEIRSGTAFHFDIDLGEIRSGTLTNGCRRSRYQQIARSLCT